MRPAIYFTLAALGIAAFLTLKLGNFDMLRAHFLSIELIMPISSFATLVFILGMLTGVFTAMLGISLVRARSSRLA